MFKLLGAFAVFVVTLLGFSFVYAKLAEVTVYDVLHRYGVGVSGVQIAVEVGDLYSISPDGLVAERLCGVPLQSVIVENKQVDVVFKNTLASNVDVIMRLWTFFTGGEPSAKTLEDSLHFVGQVSEFDRQIGGGWNDACKRDMVLRANARQKLCLVKTLVVPLDDRVATAFSFKYHQMRVPESVFQAFGETKSKAAAEIEELPCPTAPKAPWDVKLRSRLNVIVPVSSDDDARANRRLPGSGI